MGSKNVLDRVTTYEEDIMAKEEYVEMEVPYNVYQCLSSGSGQYNFDNMCRICLSTDNEVLYPLVITTENTILAHMFMALTTVQLLPDDGLPSNLCESCQTQVVQCYQFKIKCEKTDCMLKSVLKGEFITKEELPEQHMVKEEKVEPNNINEASNITGGDNSNQNIDVVDNTEVEDVQYLEDLSDDMNDDALLVVMQNKQNKIKKRLNDKHFKNEPKRKPRERRKKLISKKKLDKEDGTYTCPYCSKKFPTARAFHSHVRIKHPAANRPYSCPQCKETFNSDHDLNVHSALHSKGIWKCNICEKEFNAKTTLRRHINRHMETKRFTCDICDKAFTEQYALRRHERVHTGETVEKKHVCNICDKRYSDGHLLAAHMSRHVGLRPCECTTCGKTFPSARLLASHRLTHSDRKPYTCRYCGKGFRHESTRNTHHRTHTGEKPYVCCTCGKSFIQNSNLTLHMRTHTGERPYSCSMCDRKFTSSSTLKAHERVHSGERPFSCSICGKKFSRKNLSVHMRQHTGERPYECSVCSKKFSQASRLKEHQRVHTGEKPFECAACTMKFATKSQLIKHAKSHQKSKKKKSEKRSGLVILQPIEPAPIITDRVMFNKEHGELIRVNENVTTVQPDTESKEVTYNIVQEVPIEVTGELVLADDTNMKADLLVVDNSQNNFETNNICLDTGNVNIIGNDVNYGGDVNLVTVDEGGVSISTGNLEGTTVQLYQLDQSLVQIHSAGGQVTISRVTSKMTTNF